MNDVVISCENITKIYPMYDDHRDRFKEVFHPFRKVYHKKFHALDDVSFEVKRGETVGIVGKNGAGKSTLLKIITGVLTPTSGSVKLNGVVSSLLELGTGFNPDLTGIENIYLNSSLMGIQKEDIDKKLAQVIAFADIGEHIHQPVRGYSSGMFARLAFSVAISVEPDILIVDEALAVGDAAFVNKCYGKINELKSKGMTLLFVSHSLGAVSELCTKAILIDNGKCLLVSDVETVVNQYNRMIRSSFDKNLQENENIEETTFDSSEKDTSEISLISNVKSKDIFNINNEFMNKHSKTRYGKGGARIVNVEIIEGDDNKNRLFSYNTKIKLRVYIKSDQNLNKLNCGYFIRTDKGLSIVGNNLESSKFELRDLKANRKVI
ncbi:ABC transporter ATP-binding protein, partial [Vibrio anguillarum]